MISSKKELYDYLDADMRARGLKGAVRHYYF